MKRFLVLLAALLVLTGCSNTSVNPADDISPSPAIITPDTAPVSTPEQSPEAEPSGITMVTTPVLIEGLLVGGLYRESWVPWDVFYESGVVDFDGFEYDVYMDGAYRGQASGGPPLSFITGEPLGPDEAVSNLADVELKSADGGRVPYDIALKGDWNLFPRKYESLDTDLPQYLALAEEMITGEGIEEPKTALKQVISVDLDGDGTDEVLIAADNTVDEQMAEVKKGDNAVLIFRRIVDGQPVDQLVDSYIVTEDPEYITPYRLLFSVTTCADLDGDGVLEAVVKCWYYEGVTYSVYKLSGNQLEQVASNGVGF